LVHLRSQVQAQEQGGHGAAAPRDVLDWRFIAVVA
jgi:hypothetical protein